MGDILHGKAVLSMHRIAVLLFCLINLKWTEMSTFCKSLLHRIKPMMDRNRFNLEGGMEQKIKQDTNIGANIRAIRKQKNIKQVDLVLVSGVHDPVLSGATNRFLSENRKPIDRIS